MQAISITSLFNIQTGTKRINREAFEVGFKGWDWSMGSIQDLGMLDFIRTQRGCALFSRVTYNNWFVRHRFVSEHTRTNESFGFRLRLRFCLGR